MQGGLSKSPQARTAMSLSYAPMKGEPPESSVSLVTQQGASSLTHQFQSYKAVRDKSSIICHSAAQISYTEYIKE